MSDQTLKQIGKALDMPKVTRDDAAKFHSKADYELYLMMCDQIDAGKNCDFYMKKANQGFVKMPDGERRKYFRK